MAYCPYCPLTRAEWSKSPECHPVHEDWTLEKLTAMYFDNTKHGTAKLGVKSLPKIECIEVGHYTFPGPHVGLGVDNDTIERFENRVEDMIVKIPDVDRKMRNRLVALEGEIEMKRQDVRDFDDTIDGKLRDKLVQQKRDANKAMTGHEISLLASLDAQRKALTQVRDIAKHSHLSELEQAKKALKDFDMSKTGGKKRTTLMAKRRKSGKHLTDNEDAALKQLTMKRKSLENMRENALNERRTISDKLEENTQMRRKDSKFWFVHYDRLYKKHGV